MLAQPVCEETRVVTTAAWLHLLSCAVSLLEVGAADTARPLPVSWRLEGPSSLGQGVRVSPRGREEAVHSLPSL